MKKIEAILLYFKNYLYSLSYAGTYSKIKIKIIYLHKNYLESTT